MTFTGRLGNDVTTGYPELAAIGTALRDRAAVRDGEIVAFDDRGRPSFERLQSRIHVRGPSRTLMAEVPVLCVILDVLWLDGHTYSTGIRSKAWTKVKCVRQGEFVVGGWSEGSGGRSGQVGSGLNEFLLGHLRSAFKDLASETTSSDISSA